MVETVINPNDGFVSITAAGGETDLDFDFPIYEKSHLRIIRTRSGTDTDLVLNTDYTIADNQLEVTAGGTAVLSVSATAGDVYSLLLDVPEGRTTDFNQAGDFRAYTVNRELDLQTQMIQGLRRDVDKSARLPDDSTLTSLTLPDPEANKLLGWNSGATGLENKVITDASTTTISAFMGTLLDDSTASEARTTLGLGTMATQAASSVAITGGSIAGITDLPIADGGTGASTASAAFDALKQNATDTSTGVVEKATQAEMEAETADKYPDAVLMKYHPGIAKAWIAFNGTGTPAIVRSYNVSSITDNGVGDYTINLTSAFSSENYCVVATHNAYTDSTAHPRWSAAWTLGTGSFKVKTVDSGDAGFDGIYITAVAYGDQ